MCVFGICPTLMRTPNSRLGLLAPHSARTFCFPVMKNVGKLGISEAFSCRIRGSSVLLTEFHLVLQIAAAHWHTCRDMHPCFRRDLSEKELKNTKVLAPCFNLDAWPSGPCVSLSRLPPLLPVARSLARL